VAILAFRQAFHNRKAKYGGLEVSEAKRPKGLESGNSRLKKLLAGNAALKDPLAKIVTPPAKREAVAHLAQQAAEIGLASIELPRPNDQETLVHASRLASDSNHFFSKTAFVIFHLPLLVIHFREPRTYQPFSS
jgi:hypothetical protein